MKLDQIKQKVLELAISGKLVPQDINDEPASSLIEIIKKEKAKLAHDGKTKIAKEESYIYKGSDNSYYENFSEMPSSWMLCKFGDIVNICRGASPRPIKEHLSNNEDSVPWIKIGDTKPGEIYIKNTSQRIKKESIKHSVFLKKGTLILSNSMSFGRPYILAIDGCIHDGWLAIETIGETINKEFLQYILQGYMWYFKNKATGTGVDNLNIDRVKEMPFALPPIKEQGRILKKLLEFDALFSKLNKEKTELSKYVIQAKQKILNEYFSCNSCYKSYYENEYSLGELLPYEQPGPYIVKSTKYNSDYKTPVLTPGKTFILGYTNETDGIYIAKNKVIIFDDFTTASRLVDFDFKVKSSAIKILHSVDNDRFNIEYLYYLLQTITIINNTHKRYWISEYAPIKVKIHNYDEQLLIVQKIKQSIDKLDSIN